MKAITNIASGWLLALTFAAVDTAALAADTRSAETRPAETQPATTQPTSKRLQFEVSTEARGVQRGADPDVNYRAVVSIRDTVRPEWIFGESPHVPDNLLRTPAGQSFSERQRAIIARGSHSCEFVVSGESTLGFVHRWTLDGATEDDARKMTTALVECYEQYRQAHAEQNRKALQEKREAIRETEKERQEAYRKVRGLRQELDEMEKNHISYSVQDEEELDKALRSVEVDLASIQAKMKTIDRLQNDAQTRASVLPVLDQMRVTQAVDLAGALARKAALQQQRDAASRCIELGGQLDKGNKECDVQEKVQAGLRNDASALVKQLGPVEVVGKVTIYRAAHQAP